MASTRQSPGLRHAIQPRRCDISLLPVSAKKPAVEVHKFGGASLADGGAYRHAVAIVKGRPGAAVVVVSAPGGITDVLLGLATRAVGGERGDKIDRDVAALRARYQRIASEAVSARAARGGPKVGAGAA